MHLLATELSDAPALEWLHHDQLVDSFDSSTY